MATDVLVLTECKIDQDDARRALKYLGLEGESELSVTIAVPADTSRNLAVEVIDELSLFDLKAAWETMMSANDRNDAEEAASELLEHAKAAFSVAGQKVDGFITGDNPVSALNSKATELSVHTVVVFSAPQAVEETFQRDWAHRLQQALEIPVLHLYPGRPTIGTA